MFELIRLHQLNIMLILCGACGILTFLLLNTRFLSGSRKAILILMEVVAFFLLLFDRFSYIYAGDLSRKAYIMVRVSNFMVFFLTSAIVFGFNLYIADLLKNEGKRKTLPRRMFLTSAMPIVGMVLSIIAAFTNLYYFFDETNIYHRGQGFLIAYIIPVLCPIIQYTVVRQNKKLFSRLIYISLVLYIFVPIACGILQIFTYGISIVNMSLVGVSVFLYVFMYLDLNNTVEHAHEIEIRNMQGEQERIKRLFDQTATAFVSAVEKKDDFTRGNSLKVAEYAKKIAALSGKGAEECEQVYYAALLHDVGLIGIPDSVIKNDADPSESDYETMRKKPLIGEEILSSISEHPYLSQGAHYSHERYNGTGYPEGLKGDEIPEIARIIGVADAYVTMTTKKRYRDERPGFIAREALIKGAGEEFDPVFANLMVKIIDAEGGNAGDASLMEKEIECLEYRDSVSAGIPVENERLKISFDCEMPLSRDRKFCAPSIILFDSFDGRTHDNKRAIEIYHYLEYGEIWFDKYSIITEARKIEEKEIPTDNEGLSLDRDDHYEIITGRYEDHIKLLLRSKDYCKEVTVALINSTNSAFIGLTGENCRIKNILTESLGETVGPGDIERIVEPVSYIDHLESDYKNVQIDRTRSAYTEGVEIKKYLELAFHTLSLPGADLVWHCPYVVLFSSDDGRVGGDNYKEYSVIKLNGENDDISDEIAVNRFIMKRKNEFPGWDKWREINQRGMDCRVTFERRGNVITMKTENLGISIENTTTIAGEPVKVYTSLTGDQVALTDIRVDLCR